MRLIDTLRMIRGWWGGVLWKRHLNGKTGWMSLKGQALGGLSYCKSRSWGKNKKIGSNLFLRNLWPTMVGNLHMCREDESRCHGTRSFTGSDTALYQTVPLCDSVWQCVTVCDTVQRQSSAFFRGKLTTLVLPLLLTTSRQLVNKEWTGTFLQVLDMSELCEYISGNSKIKQVLDYLQMANSL